MKRRLSSAAAFTLIELMAALAIGALLLMAAVPAIRGAHKPPSVRALNLLLDGFREARSRAVLTGAPTRLVLREGGASLTVEPAPDLLSDSQWSATGAGNAAAPADSNTPEAPEGTPTEGSKPVWWSGHFPDEVAFRRLTVNLKDRMQAQAAAVRFFPNGACDAFDAELAWPGREVFHVTLDIMTGAPDVATIQ